MSTAGRYSPRCEVTLANPCRTHVFATRSEQPHGALYTFTFTRGRTRTFTGSFVITAAHHNTRCAPIHPCQFVTEQDLTEGAPAVPKNDVAFFAKEAPPKDGGYLYAPWIDAVFAR